MIAYLKGKVIWQSGATLVIENSGVGYEVQCSNSVLSSIAGLGSQVQIHIYPHFKKDGLSFYGFRTPEEKRMFLDLLKADGVGPKGALNILAAAPLMELVSLVHEGEAKALSEYPKISRKTADSVALKLKGKLQDLIGDIRASTPSAHFDVNDTRNETRKKRIEAQTALGHLGYKPQDVERVLGDFESVEWQGDFEDIIRRALGELSGS